MRRNGAREAVQGLRTTRQLETINESRNNRDRVERKGALKRRLGPDEVETANAPG